MSLKNFKVLILMLAFIAFPLKVVLAQDFIPPMPNDLDKTRIGLMTVDLGDTLYARYGHTMLRVEDPSHNLDYMVNWGIFDFSDPFFIPKFFRGILIYQMGFSGSRPTINYYRDIEKRGLVEDELVLTTSQKKQLIEKIIWNAQPENYRYPYQYFRNNCATIPRDYLDTILKGAIRQRFENAETKLTYRDYVRQNLSINPIVAWGLDVIFNGDSDHYLSQWQEMFYPVKLREHLAKMPRIDDNGNPVPGQTLLRNHIVVIDLPEPNGEAIDGYLLTWLVSGLPLLAVGFVLVRAQRRKVNEIPAWCFRVFGLVSIWWGLTHGFFGLTHFAAWLFSSHTDLHHNLNILLFWPTDILVLVVGLQMGVFGRGWDFKGWIPKSFWPNLARLHLWVMPLYVLIALSGLVHQDTSRVVTFMVPLSLLYYLVMIRLSRCRLLH